MMNLSAVTSSANESSELVCFFWHGSFFANSDLRALISVVTSYYYFDIKIHADFPGRVAVSLTIKLREVWSEIMTFKIANLKCKIFSWQVSW